MKADRSRFQIVSKTSTETAVKELLDRFEEKKLELGITIQDLCAEAGISFQTFYNISSGAHKARPRTIRKIRKALDRLEQDLS